MESPADHRRPATPSKALQEDEPVDVAVVVNGVGGLPGLLCGWGVHERDSSIAVREPPAEPPLLSLYSYATLRGGRVLFGNSLFAHADTPSVGRYPGP